MRWYSTCWFLTNPSVAYFTKEFNPSLSKPPLKFNGSSAKFGLTSIVESTDVWHYKCRWYEDILNPYRPWLPFNTNRSFHHSVHCGIFMSFKYILWHNLDQFFSGGLQRLTIWSKALSNYCQGYSWWRHQMETFSASLAICAGNSLVPGEFPPHKGQWRGALMFSLICTRMHGWVNNDEAGDLRRLRVHYDVTVMITH